MITLSDYSASSTSYFFPLLHRVSPFENFHAYLGLLFFFPFLPRVSFCQSFSCLARLFFSFDDNDSKSGEEMMKQVRTVSM